METFKYKLPLWTVRTWSIPVPDFILVPGAETMQLISIVSLIVGICVTVVGVLFLFLNKRKGKKKNTLAWILICVGVLLIANHGIQLIFRR